MEIKTGREIIRTQANMINLEAKWVAVDDVIHLLKMSPPSIMRTCALKELTQSIPKENKVCSRCKGAGEYRREAHITAPSRMMKCKCSLNIENVEQVKE